MPGRAGLCWPMLACAGLTYAGLCGPLLASPAHADCFTTRYANQEAWCDLRGQHFVVMGASSQMGQ